MKYSEMWECIVRHKRRELNRAFDNYLDGLIEWAKYCEMSADFDTLMKLYRRI